MLNRQVKWKCQHMGCFRKNINFVSLGEQSGKSESQTYIYIIITKNTT